MTITRWMISALFIMLLTLGAVSTAFSAERPIDIEAKSLILMEMDTGEVLIEENSDEAFPPASMTKMMTMLLLMEAIEAGDVNFEDEVTVSEKAASMGGSQIFLEEGETMIVRDLLKAIAVASGNDASVAVAEHLAGSEEDFVEMMNEKVDELGLTHTQFQNSNGLPADEHYASAHDLAVIARELMRHEGITSFTSIYEDYLRQGTDDEFWLVNTNRLVNSYEGMDGVKTGFTREAKYGLAASAKRGDARYIAVVMGADSPKERNRHITDALDYAFETFEVHPLIEKGRVIGAESVSKGMKETVPLRVKEPVSVLLKRGEGADDIEEQLLIDEEIEAPVVEGEPLGKLQLTKDEETVADVPVLAAEDVEKASLWHLFQRSLSRLSGLR
ncbi:D-Ala-D-Ala carboxypeptidase DacF [Salsuginibacillus halophilus]|uniref:serine-type D-Ala-D-Ala carboxypeptidase n=1 Tax=Salsuginibacillus halophilus TaxID=517424 RepID=A0A2P8HAT7_9BACI|nr:D-alanyl-D-alanine carboxypeptidase family protein [Salsuginibacillus halophilus]PSL43299.1 D-Ala-D-Ala carboxypeptidase DacF [Salsuginibacillus halophilus]